MSREDTLAAEQEPHLHSNGSPRPSKNKKRASKTSSPSASPQEDQSASNPPTVSPMLGQILQSGQSSRVPIFVASLGNPKPYLNTLHSAGHIVLTFGAFQQEYTEWRPFAGGQIADANQRTFSFIKGYTKQGAPLPTLWKCGSLMNASGPAVKKAWLKWKEQRGLQESDKARLIIVHDELEKALGDVSVRTNSKASARGHNGLKSVMAHLPNEPFIRIGVGIGRPDSREKDAVSKYVLGNISVREGKELETAAWKVMQQIQEIEEGSVG